MLKKIFRDQNNKSLIVGKTFNILTVRWPEKGARPIIPELEILYEENSYAKSHFKSPLVWENFSPGVLFKCDLSPIIGFEIGAFFELIYLSHATCGTWDEVQTRGRQKYGINVPQVPKICTLTRRRPIRPNLANFRV